MHGVAGLHRNPLGSLKRSPDPLAELNGGKEGSGLKKVEGKGRD